MSAVVSKFEARHSLPICWVAQHCDDLFQHDLSLKDEGIGAVEHAMADHTLPLEVELP